LPVTRLRRMDVDSVGYARLKRERDSRYFLEKRCLFAHAAGAPTTSSPRTRFRCPVLANDRQQKQITGHFPREPLRVYERGALYVVRHFFSEPLSAVIRKNVKECSHFLVYRMARTPRNRVPMLPVSRCWPPGSYLPDHCRCSRARFQPRPGPGQRCTRSSTQRRGSPSQANGFERFGAIPF